MARMAPRLPVLLVSIAVIFATFTSQVASRSDNPFDLSAYEVGSEEPWDLDAPCQSYVEKLAAVQARMAQCATNWSIPPKVCTNCWEHYINFKQYEYVTQHLDNVTSLDNRTCTQVIYDNYLISYGHDISDALTTRIWEKSRCESCLTISWNFTHNDSTISFSQQTLDFQEKLFDWRNCIANATEAGSLLGNDTTVCTACKKPFNTLFSFYWDIYIRPGVEFCVDVETTMNDTMRIWNDVWGCAERKDRKTDARTIVYTSIALGVITFIFYVGSYVQGGGAPRNLIQYSRMPEPGGARSRLLSASMSDTSFVPVMPRSAPR